MSDKYHTSGLPELDEILGEGFKQGSFVVLMGATGIGKTTFLVNTSLSQEEYPGVFYDLTQRTNPQPILDFIEDHPLGKKSYREFNTEDYSAILTRESPLKRTMDAIVLKDIEISGIYKKIFDDCFVYTKEDSWTAWRLKKSLRSKKELPVFSEMKNSYWEHPEHTPPGHLVSAFIQTSYDFGSRILIMDGETNKEEFVENIIDSIKEKLNTDKNPNKETVIRSFTVKEQYTQPIFNTFNTRYPLCNDADTVLILGWKNMGEGKPDARVLKIAKHRWASAAPSEFIIKKEDNKKLSLERLL